MDGVLFKTEYYSALKAYFSGAEVGDEQQVVLRRMETSQAH
jgi:hypothetical protein